MQPAEALAFRQWLRSTQSEAVKSLNLIMEKRKKRLLVKATSLGIEKAEKALLRLGFKTKSNFAKSRLLSRSTVTNFFTFKPIQKDSFETICEALELDWSEIADLSDQNGSELVQESNTVSSSEESDIVASLPLLHEPQEIELRSEKNIDYSNLRNLLMAGKWRRANVETSGLMLKVAGLESAFTLESIEQFPCTDLRTIDQLWLKYSNRRFGFSVQKLIYQKLGESYGRLSNYVGWRQGEEWIKDSQDLIFNLDAPLGHLPYVVWGVYVDELLSRFEACNSTLNG